MLEKYDRDNIEPKIVNKVRKDFLHLEDFQKPRVEKCSKAAYGLCCWVNCYVSHFPYYRKAFKKAIMPPTNANQF